MSLAKSTLINVVWSFFEQLLRKGTAIITTLVLAFLLTPDDFGLVAMLTLFISIGYVVIDAGTRAAIIREPNISEQALSSIFYLNIAVGSLFYIFLCFSAPMIADFYQQPLLIHLIYFAGLSFVFFAFSIVPSAVMQRNMQYKLQFKTVLPGAVISSLIAIVLAYLEYGVWAIIWQMVTAPFINAGLYWFSNIWHPSYSFSIDSIKHMFKFSFFVFLENITKELYGRIYVAAVGKFFLLGTVGLYFFAKKVAEMVVQQLVTAIQQVTFSALSRVQDDTNKLKESYQKVIQVTIFLVFPVLFLMATMSNIVFQVFLPEKWWGAAHYLQYMLIIALLLPLHDISTNLFLVKEKSHYTFYFSLAMMILTLISLYFTVNLSIDMVLIGEFVVVFATYILKMFFMSRLISYSVEEQLKDLVPVITISMILSAVLIYLDDYFQLTLELWVKFIVFSFSYVVSYVLLTWLFNVQGFRLAKQLVLARRKKLD